MFVKGLLVKKLFDENLEFAIEGDNVVARQHNTTILIPGNIYRAELDGEVYEASARKITNDDASLVFDNFEIRDYYASDNLEVTIYNSTNTAARNVKIYSVNHHANKINPDLLPDNIGGGAPSWHDIKDRPFGEKPPLFDIRWNGETDGYETAVVVEAPYVKVSDFVVSNTADLVGVELTIFHHDSGREEVVTMAEGYTHYDVGGAIDVCTGLALFIYDADTFASANEIPADLFSNGVWLLRGEYAYISALTAPTKVKKLDSKYLPTLKIYLDSNGNYTSNMTYDEILEAISADPFFFGMFINQQKIYGKDFIQILSGYLLPPEGFEQIDLYFDGDWVGITSRNEIFGEIVGE